MRKLRKQQRLVSISDLASTMSRVPAAQKQRPVALLKRTWGAVVGSSLARVCSPLRLAETTLVISVFEKQWVDLLEGDKVRLCQRIQLFYPQFKIEDCKFVMVSQRRW